MWLQTVHGFYSVVQKPGEKTLTLRARAKGDLVRLRERYLPSLGEIRDKEGSDYPYRAETTHKAFAEALGRMAGDIHYSNFKDEVSKQCGHVRAGIYHKLWKALAAITKEDDAPVQTAKVSGLAPAFGAVVFNERGQILLREPAKHFDDYVWTFPKGRPRPGESPEQCALRELREEGGVEGRIVSEIPGRYEGGTTINRYLLVELVADHGDFSTRETQAVKWAAPDEAKDLIRQTTNPKGQQRDLAVLRAAIALVPQYRPHCSKCSGYEDLCLVVAGAPPGGFGRNPGRLLVYCGPCRRATAAGANMQHDAAIPLGIVNEDVFVALYEHGATESAPEIACEIVFGRPVATAVERAHAALHRKRS